MNENYYLFIFNGENLIIFFIFLTFDTDNFNDQKDC